MRVLLVLTLFSLMCVFDANCQIANDEVSVMTISGDHVLINNPRILVYPKLTAISNELAKLNSELVDKKINVLVRIYKDKVEYLKLKASNRLSQDILTDIDKLLKINVKYFLLDKPNLKGVEYFDFSYTLKITH